MSPPYLTPLEHWLATDLQGALEAIMARHRREHEAELWLTIVQLDAAMDAEMRRPNQNADDLRKAQHLKVDILRDLGLPPTTDTRKKRSE
jgi:hypothetical protein